MSGWKKRDIVRMEKQSLGGSTKTKGGNRRVNKASPAPSRKGGSKTKNVIATQLTKLGGGTSGTLQLIKSEAGDIGDCDMSNSKDDLRKNALDNTDDMDMSNEPVKTTPLITRA